jgi:hypothetical protein
MRIIPPLIISKQEFQLALSILDEVMTVLERGAAKLSEIIPQNSRSRPFISGMFKRTPVDLLRKMWHTSPHQWLKRARSARQRA